MTWISPQEAAKFTLCDVSTVRRRAKLGEYGTNGFHYVSGSSGRGGKRLEIHLESLPSEAQAAYHNAKGNIQSPINNREGYTLSQRKKGELRALVVSRYKKYRRERIKGGVIKETDIMQDFVIKWNVEHPDFTFTVKTLYEWRRKSKSGDAERLVDKRGGYNRGQSSIPDEMLKYFKNLFLQESKPSIFNCYRLTQLEANKRGITIPGVRAFETAVSNIPAPILALHREGAKYFSDHYMPYTERDYEKLFPNDRWVSDHHLWDAFVRVPNGMGGWIAKRPWGTYWQDMRTRKIMSSIVRVENPNSDVVVCSFGIGVEEFGVPRSVLLDNGRDYKAKDVFNTECKEIINSLAVNLQLDTVYAIPYNAKAKPIERTFSTFEEQFGKLHNTYAGSNAKERPEKLKELDIMEYPTLEEFVTLHNQYVYEVYNNATHKGAYMYDKTPNQMYAALPFSIRRVSKDVLYFCLMRVKGKRVVQRNGVTFNGIHYYNDNVINYIGKSVFAKYDPTKPDILYLFDENENYLFIATKIVKLGFAPTKEDYHREGSRRKTARHNALDGYTPDKTIGTVDGVKKLMTQQAVPQTVPQVGPSVTELLRNPKIEETVRRVNMNDAERQYSDALAGQEATKQMQDEKKKRYADSFKKLCKNDIEEKNREKREQKNKVKREQPHQEATI